jgi:hypothetical protein
MKTFLTKIPGIFNKIDEESDEEGSKLMNNVRF